MRYSNIKGRDSRPFSFTQTFQFWHAMNAISDMKNSEKDECGVFSYLCLNCFNFLRSTKPKSPYFITLASLLTLSRQNQLNLTIVHNSMTQYNWVFFETSQFQANKFRSKSEQKFTNRLKKDAVHTNLENTFNCEPPKSMSKHYRLFYLSANNSQFGKYWSRWIGLNEKNFGSINMFLVKLLINLRAVIFLKSCSILIIMTFDLLYLFSFAQNS